MSDIRELPMSGPSLGVADHLRRGLLVQAGRHGGVVVTAYRDLGDRGLLRSDVRVTALALAAAAGELEVIERAAEAAIAGLTPCPGAQDLALARALRRAMSDWPGWRRGDGRFVRAVGVSGE